MKWMEEWQRFTAADDGFETDEKDLRADIPTVISFIYVIILLLQNYRRVPCTPPALKQLLLIRVVPPTTSKCRSTRWFASQDTTENM